MKIKYIVSFVLTAILLLISGLFLNLSSTKTLLGLQQLHLSDNTLEYFSNELSNKTNYSFKENDPSLYFCNSPKEQSYEGAGKAKNLSYPSCFYSYRFMSNWDDYLRKCEEKILFYERLDAACTVGEALTGPFAELGCEGVEKILEEWKEKLDNLYNCAVNEGEKENDVHRWEVIVGWKTSKGKKNFSFETQFLKDDENFDLSNKIFDSLPEKTLKKPFCTSLTWEGIKSNSVSDCVFPKGANSTGAVLSGDLINVPFSYNPNRIFIIDFKKLNLRSTFHTDFYLICPEEDTCPTFLKNSSHFSEFEEIDLNPSFSDLGSLYKIFKLPTLKADINKSYIEGYSIYQVKNQKVNHLLSSLKRFGLINPKYNANVVLKSLKDLMSDINQSASFGHFCGAKYYDDLNYLSNDLSLSASTISGGAYSKDLYKNEEYFIKNYIAKILPVFISDRLLNALTEFIPNYTKKLESVFNGFLPGGFVWEKRSEVPDLNMDSNIQKELSLKNISSRTPNELNTPFSNNSITGIDQTFNYEFLGDFGHNIPCLNPIRPEIDDIELNEFNTSLGSKTGNYNNSSSYLSDFGSYVKTVLHQGISKNHLVLRMFEDLEKNTVLCTDKVRHLEIAECSEKVPGCESNSNTSNNQLNLYLNIESVEYPKFSWSKGGSSYHPLDVHGFLDQNDNVLYSSSNLIDLGLNLHGNFRFPEIKGYFKIATESSSPPLIVQPFSIEAELNYQFVRSKCERQSNSRKGIYLKLINPEWLESAKKSNPSISLADDINFMLPAPVIITDMEFATQKLVALSDHLKLNPSDKESEELTYSFIDTNFNAGRLKSLMEKALYDHFKQRMLKTMLLCGEYSYSAPGELNGYGVFHFSGLNCPRWVPQEDEKACNDDKSGSTIDIDGGSEIEVVGEGETLETIDPNENIDEFNDIITEIEPGYDEGGSASGGNQDLIPSLDQGPNNSDNNVQPSSSRQFPNRGTSNPVDRQNYNKKNKVKKKKTQSRRLRRTKNRRMRGRK